MATVGFTQAFSQTTLDAAIVNGDKVYWSSNGTTQNTHVAATAIAAWTASTAADPAVRVNTSAVDSAACDADTQTFTHFAIYDSAGTTQKTEYTALGSPRTLMTGDKLSIAAGAIQVTLT